MLLTKSNFTNIIITKERNIVYGIYYLAIPIGAAFGFIIGGAIGGKFGWRVAFFIIGDTTIIFYDF